jgi:hypothetical protein
VERLAPVLRIKVGHDCREAFRGPLWHSANDVQPDPAADPAPGALLQPDLTLAGFFPFDGAGAQRAGGQARALRAARPPSMQEGKTPHARLIRVEQDDLASTRPIVQSRQVDGALGEVCGLGIEAARGATVAQRIFFQTPRRRSRPKESPVWCARPRARARPLPGAESAPWGRGS